MNSILYKIENDLSCPSEQFFIGQLKNINTPL